MKRSSPSCCWSSFKYCRTSLDEVASFVAQLRRFVVVTNELLTTETVQRARAQVEESGEAEKHDRHRKVDVKTTADDLYHVHVTHDLKIERNYVHIWSYDILFWSGYWRLNFEVLL